MENVEKKLKISLCDIRLCFGRECDRSDLRPTMGNFNFPLKKENIDMDSNLKMQQSDLIEVDNEMKSEILSDDNDLSEYGKRVKRNREERLAFLQSLKLNEAKESFLEAVQKTKPKRTPRVLKRPNLSAPVPVRKSRRLAKLDIDLSETALFNKAMAEALEEQKKKPCSTSQKVVDPAFHTDAFQCPDDQTQEIPEHYSFNEAAEDKEDYHKLFDNLDFKTEDTKQFNDYISRFKKMKIELSNIAKVVPDRVTALAIHPVTDKIIVGAGSKYGNIGFWNVTSALDPVVFTPHTQNVTNFKFNPHDSLKIVSSSYDGTLRVGDLEKQVFDQVYNVSGETSCTYFDFLSSNTFLVSLYNGNISVVDVRGSQKSEKSHGCHERNIKTVNIHPVNKNLFLSADSKGLMKLWDLRKLQTKPLIQITHHKQSVSSAFFSPVNGNFILTASHDNSLGIFDSSNVGKEILFQRSIRHNNNTGRWLSPFKAVWVPNSEDAFIVGSMEYPRKVEVFSNSGSKIHNFMEENLTTITSLNEFHPSLSVLACANSSGKIFVSMDTELKF